MKATNYLIIFTLIGLFVISCQEEIIVPGESIHDTIYLPDPCKCIKHDTVILERIDTLWVETVRTQYDTVLRVVTDSVFITKTVVITQYDTTYVNHTDTLYVHIYSDTLVTFESGRPLEVLGIWKDIFIEFGRLSYEYGWTESLGGNIIIEYWTADEAPPASRSSYSYFVYDQYLVKLKESLTHDEAYTPLFREWARRVLGKKYDPEGSGTIMDPSLNPKAVTFSSTAEQKKKYLNALFSKTI